MKLLAIYTRQEGGSLSRKLENWSDCSNGTQSIEKQKSNFLDYLKSRTSQFSENPEIENLLGWPENKIEWHGNYGIGL